MKYFPIFKPLKKINLYELNKFHSIRDYLNLTENQEKMILRKKFKQADIKKLKQYVSELCIYAIENNNQHIQSNIVDVFIIEVETDNEINLYGNNGHKFLTLTPEEFSKFLIDKEANNNEKV